MKKQKDQESGSDRTSFKGKSEDDVRKHLNKREENLRDNKAVNDDDSNTGRGKYHSKHGEGKSAEPSTKGGETD